MVCTNFTGKTVESKAKSYIKSKNPRRIRQTAGIRNI
jgi:hypothetical protein